MADIFDQAQERDEQFREASIARTRQNAPGSTIRLGMVCRYCGERLSEPGLFCAVPEGSSWGCRDDWEREERAKRRNGWSPTPIDEDPAGDGLAPETINDLL